MLKNPKKIKDDLVAWIREYFAASGNNCSAVIGISGGKDSSVCAALCVEALGKERVVGVLMPNGSQSDIADSRLLVQTLDIRYLEINIRPGYEGMVEAMKDVTLSKDAYINLPPRLRMATLYAVAQSLPEGGRVINTCNRSEDYIGYSTKFGDSAGDVSLLSELLVEEVIQIGKELPLPAFLVEKTPSDGLCGQTDEDKIGFTYHELDTYIQTGEASPKTKEKIDCLHRLNLHKITPMPSFHPKE
ncbi:MAG: NAD(+) synthase [Candidatus Enteromonas sp.]|nr:NAD(+) synthase [Candidatus Enteromonas sp.]